MISLEPIGDILESMRLASAIGTRSEEISMNSEFLASTTN